MSKYPEQEKLFHALNSNNKEILSKLISEGSASIRKALAQNLNTPREILNKLAYDPVMNVSYVAVQNPNCTVKREFSQTDHPCFTCKEDESSSACQNCQLLKNYYHLK